MRRTATVVWVGNARSAALAVGCSNCNVPPGKSCETWGHAAKTWVTCAPHQARRDYAHVLGFRDVAVAPLLEVKSV